MNSQKGEYSSFKNNKMYNVDEYVDISPHPWSDETKIRERSV